MYLFQFLGLTSWSIEDILICAETACTQWVVALLFGSKGLPLQLMLYNVLHELWLHQRLLFDLG